MRTTADVYEIKDGKLETEGAPRSDCGPRRLRRPGSRLLPRLPGILTRGSTSSPGATPARTERLPVRAVSIWGGTAVDGRRKRRCRDLRGRRPVGEVEARNITGLRHPVELRRRPPEGPGGRTTTTPRPTLRPKEDGDEDRYDIHGRTGRASARLSGGRLMAREEKEKKSWGWVRRHRGDRHRRPDRPRHRARRSTGERLGVAARRNNARWSAGPPASAGSASDYRSPDGPRSAASSTRRSVAGCDLPVGARADHGLTRCASGPGPTATKGPNVSVEFHTDWGGRVDRVGRTRASTRAGNWSGSVLLAEDDGRLASSAAAVVHGADRCGTGRVLRRRRP